MKELFASLSALDKSAKENYNLTEELMMEHAAIGIKKEIELRFKKGSSILIATGSGNNGADGFALARLLDGYYDVEIFEALEPKSSLCKLQKSRALSCGLIPIKNIKSKYDIVVDAIFGSGLTKTINTKISKLITKLNSLIAFKIACDIPSGLFESGNGECVFMSDLTVTMGAAKTALFSDFAKEFVGELVIAGLGIPQELYKRGFKAEAYLLEKSDLLLPLRVVKSSHKCNYGHLAVFIGNKEGAGVLCGLSALSFGCGLVSLITKEKINIPPDLMQNNVPATNTTTICIGSGLGNTLDSSELKKLAKIDADFVIDADMFYKNEIIDFIQKGAILTPHPKEFASLLKISKFGEFTTTQIQQMRFKLAKEFCDKYPKCTLVLKGSNTIIANNNELFVCSLGSASLAKGGSGDVLAGLIGALLAQRYSPLEAAKNAVLAHALASCGFTNNYALTPSELIEKIKTL